MNGHHGRVRYFAGDWSDAEWTELRAELERRGIEYARDGDDLFVERDAERTVDMLVESITEE